MTSIDSGALSDAAVPDEAPGAPQRRGFLTLFVLAWFGLNLALGAFTLLSIPRALAAFDAAAKTTNLSLVVAAGGVAVIIITPLSGRLSDRSRSRFGMRRPWILGGAIGGLLGVAVLALAHGLWPIVIGWCVTQIGFGVTNMALHALLADQIPTRIRARIAGVSSAAGGLALIAGNFLVAALPDSAQWSWFMVPGVIGAALSGVLFFTLRDIVRTEPAPPLRPRDLVSTYWLNPVRYRDFFWAFACRMLVTMSIVAVSAYLYFLVMDRLGVPQQQATAVAASAVAVYTVANIPTTVLFGWISDRTGRRKPVVWISCLLSAAGLCILLVAHDATVFLVAMAFVGAAQGAYVSVDIALMTEVLPSFDEAGKDLGIVSLSYQLPAFLVPVVAVPLLAIPPAPNYSALFVAAIGFGLLGGLAVLPIRSVR